MACDIITLGRSARENSVAHRSGRRRQDRYIGDRSRVHARQHGSAATDFRRISWRGVWRERLSRQCVASRHKRCAKDFTHKSTRNRSCSKRVFGFLGGIGQGGLFENSQIRIKLGGHNGGQCCGFSRNGFGIDYLPRRVEILMFKTSFACTSR